MKTLTATQARQNIGNWLSRAIKGDDIGILYQGRIVALRPVEVDDEDYAIKEYGVTKYRYTVVNDRTVLVDPATHKVIQIVE